MHSLQTECNRALANCNKFYGQTRFLIGGHFSFLLQEPQLIQTFITKVGLKIFNESSLLRQGWYLFKRTCILNGIQFTKHFIEFVLVETNEVVRSLIDWCCFYYFVRNSLIALLEALCARIFFFRFVNIGFFWHFFLCAQGLLKIFSSAPLNQVVAIPLVCWLYMCACVCVPLYVHVKMCR